MRNKVKENSNKIISKFTQKDIILFIIVGLCVNYVRQRLSSQGNLKKFDKSFQKDNSIL